MTEPTANTTVTTSSARRQRGSSMLRLRIVINPACPPGK
jgi:hypothetical protein